MDAPGVLTPARWPAHNDQGVSELTDLLPNFLQKKGPTEAEIRKIMNQPGQKDKSGKWKFTAQMSADWKQSNNRIEAITPASIRAFKAGCIAGHWLSDTQTHAITTAIMSKPMFMAQTTAGKFFVDHLLQGVPKKDRARGKYTNMWSENVANYVQKDDDYSDTERAGFKETEKHPFFPATVPFMQLTNEQRKAACLLGYATQPKAPRCRATKSVGWQTCREQRVLPEIFDKEYKALGTAERSALSTLRITKTQFGHYTSAGITGRYLRQWGDLNAKDKQHARTIGYNTKPRKKATEWTGKSIAWKRDNSGDIENISGDYDQIKGHHTLWKDTPKKVQMAAAALNWPIKVWNQMATIIQHRLKAR